MRIWEEEIGDFDIYHNHHSFNISYMCKTYACEEEEEEKNSPIIFNEVELKKSNNNNTHGLLNG